MENIIVNPCKTYFKEPRLVYCSNCVYAEYSNCQGDKHLTGHMDRNGVHIYSYVCKVQPVLISDDAARQTEAGLKSIIDGQ